LKRVIWADTASPEARTVDFRSTLNSSPEDAVVVEFDSVTRMAEDDEELEPEVEELLVAFEPLYTASVTETPTPRAMTTTTTTTIAVPIPVRRFFKSIL